MVASHVLRSREIQKHTKQPTQATGQAITVTESSLNRI